MRANDFLIRGRPILFKGYEKTYKENDVPRGMAEILSQREIDALLQGKGGEGDSIADAVGDGEKPPNQGKQKVFYGHDEEKNQRFRYAYHSPLMKKKTFVLNPDLRRPHTANEVYTMEFYQRHREEIKQRSRAHDHERY